MYKSTVYRHPREVPTLLTTVLVVAVVVVLSAVLTQCISIIFVLGILAFTTFSTRAMQTNLMREAFLINREKSPELADLVEVCEKRLQPGPVQVFIMRKNMLNAYTFGLQNPRSIVLYEPMLKVMNRDELAFVLGHEMGHVALGHTLLNTIIGGLAGTPAPYGIGYLMYAIFLRWSRACEFSCDRAGLLGCGSLNRSVSALVRLAAPNIRTQPEFDRALEQIDAQDENFVQLAGEIFQSHPLIITRINQLKQYAASPEYQKLQAAMDKNLNS